MTDLKAVHKRVRLFTEGVQMPNDSHYRGRDVALNALYDTNSRAPVNPLVRPRIYKLSPQKAYARRFIFHFLLAVSSM